MITQIKIDGSKFSVLEIDRTMPRPIIIKSEHEMFALGELAFSESSDRINTELRTRHDNNIIEIKIPYCFILNLFNKTVLSGEYSMKKPFSKWWEIKDYRKPFLKRLCNMVYQKYLDLLWKHFGLVTINEFEII